MSKRPRPSTPAARPYVPKYCVLAATPFEPMAAAMEEEQPAVFKFFPTKWGKFSDSQMDNIEVGGFHPINFIRNSSVVFLASFHSNDAILSQFHVLIMLLESFISELTVVLPFYPTGTMERVTREGQVATANTIARLFSNLPSSGRPTRVMIYDIHTLQNRFYLYGDALASLHSAIPLLLSVVGPPGQSVDVIAFPDDGAHKRFKSYFAAFNQVVCAKVRDGDSRKVTIQDGDPTGRVLIVDDMVRSGGTLREAAAALKEQGATSVSAFCTHAAFKKDAWLRFAKGGEWDVFEKFYVTNSVPTTAVHLTDLPPFEVLNLMNTIIDDI